MGMFAKVLDVFKLNDDDDEYYDEEDFEEEEDKPKKKSFFFGNSDDDDDDEEDEVIDKHPARNISKITPMRGGRKGNVNGMEVCVIKPSSFEDAREIAETLLSDRTVILNMEGLDFAIGQRIIDFISGTCFAIHGNLQKVSNFIFIITPKAVDISGDLQDIMDAYDFSGLKSGF